MRARAQLGMALAAMAFGCGINGPGGEGDDDASGIPAGASGSGANMGSGPSSGNGSGAGTGSGAGMPGVPELGGTFTEVGSASDGLNSPRDLAFHPQRAGEVWTVNAPIDGTVIYFGAGTTAQQSELRIDYYSAHFMDEVSSIAMGADDSFATCQESRNGNGGIEGGDDFMGPTLWPAALNIYAQSNQGNNGLLGSHLDMLHESPQCMGIAHDHDNVYWVFDGLHGYIVRYDFAQPHIVGGDDHSDGIIRRYSDARVTRVAHVPGHLELDRTSGWLYIADTGGGRVLRLDTASGSVTGNLPPTGEYVDEYSEVEGATVEIFIDGLGQPSGIALHEGRLFVGDHATSEVIAYDVATGGELGRVTTPATGLMGLEVNAGRLWYIDGGSDELIRIDP